MLHQVTLAPAHKGVAGTGLGDLPLNFFTAKPFETPENTPFRKYLLLPVLIHEHNDSEKISINIIIQTELDKMQIYL